MVESTRKIPPSLQVVPGAVGVTFYNGLTQFFNNVAMAQALGCTEFEISRTARYWPHGTAVGALLGAATSREGYERWSRGDNYLETGGGILSIGSGGAMGSVAILSSLASGKAFPQLQPNLWHIGQLAKGAKAMGAGAGVLFVAADIYAVLGDPSVSQKEIGLAAGEAATSLAAIAITFAPANTIPVGGTVVFFIILVGASIYLGTLREEVKEERVLKNIRSENGHLDSVDENLYIGSIIKKVPSGIRK